MVDFMRFSLAKWPGLVFICALLVRVLYNVLVAWQYVPMHDSAQYRDIGLHFVQQHCFCLHGSVTTVGRAPLWPLLIGLFSLVFGSADIFVRLFLCLLDAGTCVLIYLWVCQLLNARLALVAGLIAALYPGLYVYTGWLYSETLYTFLLMAFCYMLSCLLRERQMRYVIGSGMLLGLLSLTRPNGLLLVGLFVLWALVLGWQKLYTWKYALQVALLGSVLALLLVVPWTVRNYLVTQRFLPVATGDGTVLLGSYNDGIMQQPLLGQTWINPLRSVKAVSRTFSLNTCDARCEMGREDVYKEKALQWAQAHTAELPGLMVAHFVNLWVPAIHEADLPTDRFADLFAAQAVQVMMNVLPIPLVLLAALGLLVTRRRWREFLMLYFFLLLTVVQGLVLYGTARFRAPLEPLLIVLAVCALWPLQKRLANRRQTA